MRKLMWFALGFALAALVGIYVLDSRFFFPAAGVGAILLAVTIYLQTRFSKLRIAVALLLGATVGFSWMFVYDEAYLAVAKAVDGEKIQMTLTATDYRRETDYGFSVDTVGKINGKYYKIQLYLPETAEVSPGDQLTGRFSLRNTLPGYSGHSNYWAGERTFLTARSGTMLAVKRAEKLPWYGYPAYVCRIVKTTLSACMPQRFAAFAVALLTGDGSDIDYETDTAFKISGIRHIIAVSGLHVTILFSLIYFLVGKKRLPAMLIGLPVLFFFAAVAGFSASILRACLMHSLMVCAMLWNKEYDGPTALGFAILVMLILDPWTITGVSFQLSVACMWGMFLFSEAIQNWLMDKKRLGRWKGWKSKIATAVASSVGMSLGATVFVTPLCAYYFGMVSLVGAITNLLTLWVVTFIFYGIVAVCLFGLLWKPLGSVLGYAVSIPISYVLGVSKGIAAFPLAAVYTDSRYIVLWLIFAYILLAVLLFKKKKRIFPLFCAVFLSLCISLTISYLQPQRDEFRLSVLDVGQGQCIVLQSEGKTFVVDCGGDRDTGAADTAATALLSQGIFEIDGLILTHYDRDHAAGAPYLLTRVPSKMLYLPDCTDEDAPEFSEKWEQLSVTGQTVISFGNAKITLFPSSNKDSGNESGLCVLFQTENCAILITGDRSTDGELELMEQVNLPKLDVLIVGHHGSKYSTSEELLSQTRPKIAVISVGQDNPYGHPTEEALKRLSDAGCVIYRTDLHGKVVYRG